MADKYGDNLAFNWPDQWCDADDGVQDVAAPGASDTANLTFNSGNCTLTGDVAAIVKLDMKQYGPPYAGTLAMSVYSINASGDLSLAGTITGDAGAIIYGGGDLEVDAGMSFDTDVEIELGASSGGKGINTVGVALGPLKIDAAGAAYNLSFPLSCGDFELAGGTFNFNTKAVTCGSLTISGGTFDMQDETLTLNAGSTLTHSGGELTSSTDYGATIDAGGATVTGVTASKWINVTNGFDGGGNTKLSGLTALGPPVGTLGLMGAGR